MDEYTVMPGDVLHLDYSLEINGVSHALRLSRIYVKSTNANGCTLSVESELGQSMLIHVANAINEGLVSYAEKCGGVLSAAQMRHYIDKQRFIQQLKDPT